MVMSVNSENTSLHIPEVNSTDSGLYYCCIQRMNYIIFSNATLLQVKVSNVSSEVGLKSDVFFNLTYNSLHVTQFLGVNLFSITQFYQNVTRH
ncbi:hypothetical protein NFI96_022045 [Prochilodus magdalenae]|nr:hypothetical protein NFI96_022045 [Prochilodus magdalenae]